MSNTTDRALQNISDTLRRIEVHLKPKSTVTVQQYISGGPSKESIVEGIPVHFDWVNPSIEGVAKVIPVSGGRVSFVVEFEDLETEARFLQSLNDVTPELFQISSMPI